jgi:uncharacterized protein YndB with AHSA1/START domain
VSNIEPVKKQIVVEASQEHAFRVFTEGIDKWWPREHHIGKSPLAREVLEPRAGGRWYGLSEDGSECDAGKVLIWDPPRRLVLSWQLTAQWLYDPNFMTEVEVKFIAEGPKRTRVELEHRNLERYGDAAPEFRKMLDAPGGWGGSLESFAKTAAA